MKIGFDIDGVIVDYTASINALLRDKYGISVQELGIPYIDAWQIESYFPKLPKAVLEDIHAYVCCNLAFIRNCTLRKPVLAIIDQLHKQGHTLSIVTNRPKAMMRETLIRLYPFASCFQNAAFYEQESKDYNKVKRCRKLGLDVLIDDQLNNLTKVALETDTKALLFIEEPWLKDVKFDRNLIMSANNRTLMDTLQSLSRSNS